MSQWLTLFRKELLELWRNFKWIWVPITFILLGATKPVTTYYTPQILKSVGNLPKGAKFEFPTPSAPEVLIQSLSQYTSLGVLIIVLTTMGIIAAERKSGVAAMILVKPVSYSSFVTAKWASAFLLVWVAFLFGDLASWYYTGILFDWIPLGDFFQTFFLYGLWLTVVMTLTLFFSSLLLSPGAAGFSALAVTIVLSLVSSTLSNVFKWSPSQLPGYADQILLSKGVSDDLMPACYISALIIVVFLVWSIVIFRKKELAA
jgi:ABC-2 type transport system permease protein